MHYQTLHLSSELIERLAALSMHLFLIRQSYKKAYRAFEADVCSWSIDLGTLQLA